MKPIVFIHIAKTAGTSLLSHLHQHFAPEEIISHGDFLDFPGEQLPEDALSRYKVISGHFGYKHVAHLLPEATSVTFLRDPTERLLSFYRFCLHEDMQRRFPVARSAAELGPDGFFSSTRPEVVEAVDNLQCWQLAHSYWYADREVNRSWSDADLLETARTHLQSLSLAGTTANFNDDFQRFLGLAGLPAPAEPPRELRTAEPLQVEDLKPETLATIRERNALDYALLEALRDSS